MATPQQEPIHSKAAVAGHPIHPMMVHLPVAALVMLLPVDIAYLWTADPFWQRAGLWLAGVGAAGGWIASLFGLVDILFVRRIRYKITAWCHAILAIMMLSLASLNWLLKFQGMGGVVANLFWGVYLSALTAAVIALTAYLGGRLVYEHAVAVDTSG